jgi:hypothetical protein
MTLSINSTQSYPSGTSFTEIVNTKIKDAQKNNNKSEQVKSFIHKKVNYYYYYYSINLLVDPCLIGKSLLKLVWFRTTAGSHTSSS